MADSSPPNKPPPLSDDLLKDDDDDDLFVSAIEHKPKPEVPTEGASSSVLSPLGEDDPGHEIDLNADEERGAVKEPQDLKAEVSSPLPPPQTPPASLDVQQICSVSTSKVPTSITNEASDELIEVVVGEPKKIGDGYGSYVVYKVTTKTNLPFFRRNSFSVNRRFSDFRGLRDKLAEKHMHVGRIVPPAPEKDAVGTAKVKMSKEDDIGHDEFIEKRRMALERYLNRTAAHPILRADPDFREFLELDTDLPKATSTSALSGAGVRRFLNKFGDTVNKMTFKMDEADPWFEDKAEQIESLDQQLRKLQASVDALIHHRKELSSSTSSFARSCAILGNCEEHTSLSCALSQLADTEEKIEQVYTQQVNADFAYLSDLIKDYINLIGAVKDTFHQRVKVYQTWQHAQQQLNRKREAKARAELAARSDKVAQANEEVLEWEAKVNRGQEEFENISKTIKLELEKFEITRVQDFKNNIIRYMESLLETQQQLIKHWESFLPEAKAIS